MTANDSMNAIIQMLVGGLVIKCIHDGGFVQAIQIAQLKQKMDRKRKRRNPKAYIKWDVQQSCQVEYGENDR